jgi:polysaccharide pyruvyl transferase WcaK-like protein
LHSEFERAIAERFAATSGARIRDGFYPDVLSDFQRLSCFVGTMMHSNVFACAAGVPFIPIAYDQKTVEFASTICLEEPPVSIFDIDEQSLFSRIVEVIQHRPALSDKIDATRRDLKARYNNFMDHIAEDIIRNAMPGR